MLFRSTTEFVANINATNVNSATIGNIGANHVGTGTYLTSLPSFAYANANVTAYLSGTAAVGNLQAGVIGNITTPNSSYQLEMTGDLPDADVKPPEEVLFVCKLNPVTRDEDLELIFSNRSTLPAISNN